MNKKAKTEANPKIILGIILGLIFFLLFGFSIYLTMQRPLARFSMDFFYPYLKTVRTIENHSAEALLATENKRTLAEMATMLQKENARLAMQASLLPGYEMENAKLRRLLKLQPPPKFRAVYAEVLLRDPATWNEMFTIDRGSRDGIRPGDLATVAQIPDGHKHIMPIVIGRVKSVSEHSACVVTLCSPDCTLSVELAESNAHGLLRGTGNGMQISQLPANEKYGIGEIVTTSGYSDQIPQGLYVGKLLADKTGGAARITRQMLSAEAELAMEVPYANVHFVAILVRGH